MTGAEKPAGAWTAEETVLFMLDRVRSGDFYILVPDNETRRAIDELRILWAAGGAHPCVDAGLMLTACFRRRYHGGQAGPKPLAPDL